MDPINQVMQARQGALDMQIQVAVARKALDAQQAVGDAVNQLLESAVQLSKGIGVGQEFDAVG